MLHADRQHPPGQRQRDLSSDVRARSSLQHPSAVSVSIHVLIPPLHVDAGDSLHMKVHHSLF